MKAPHHLWRTADGRLVQTGHLDAEVLAYPAGSEIPDDEARKLGLLDEKKPAKADADTKQATPAANKQRGKAADK